MVSKKAKGGVATVRKSSTSKNSLVKISSTLTKHATTRVLTAATKAAAREIVARVKPSGGVQLSTEMRNQFSALALREISNEVRVQRLKVGPANLTFAAGLEAVVANSEKLTKRVESISKSVVVTIAPHTRGGVPLQNMRGRLSDVSIDDFRPDVDAAAKAAEKLRSEGFVVRRVGRFGITVEGAAELVSDVLGVRMTVQSRPRRETMRSVQQVARSFVPPKPSDLFCSPAGSLAVKSPLTSIDHFLFIPPPLFFVDGTPPSPGYHHANAGTLRQYLNVPDSSTGEGIKVAVIDTGFYEHPYYRTIEADYRPTPTATSRDVRVDEQGHGTAICANVFAVAPKATVLGIKQTLAPQDQLEEAIENGADIISCSWGWDYEQSFAVLELLLRDIVNTDKKVVLFASGNGQHAWPGTMPEILSVGGVYVDNDGEVRASNYASGFVSSLYPNRRVPDLCGLCGEIPKGIYIPMPCPPGSEMDSLYSGQSFPEKDETGARDGWVVASGTSSATPQIAGVVALMQQARRDQNAPDLDPSRVKQILESTSTAVETGFNAFGFPAHGVPNTAVGYGLVNASKAISKV